MFCDCLGSRAWGRRKMNGSAVPLRTRLGLFFVRLQTFLFQFLRCLLPFALERKSLKWNPNTSEQRLHILLTATFLIFFVCFHFVHSSAQFISSLPASRIFSKKFGTSRRSFIALAGAIELKDVCITWGKESLSCDGVHRLPHTSLGRSPESCKIISMMSAEKVFGKIKFLFAGGERRRNEKNTAMLPLFTFRLCWHFISFFFVSAFEP